MARKGISVVEQHVEKAILAVFAGALVYVVVQFVAGSPNTIDLKGNVVDASKIDDYVKDTADTVWSSIRNARSEVEEIIDLPKFQEELVVGPLARADLQLSVRIASGVPFGIPVPEVQGPGARGQVSLAGLVAPEKPRVSSGRYSAFLWPSNAAPICEDISDKEWNLMVHDREQDLSWVTVAVPFDVEKQKKAFLDSGYATTRLGVEATGVFLQRQKSLPDGAWGDWEDVPTFKKNYLTTPPAMNILTDDEGEASISIDERKEFVTWLDEVRLCMPEVIRPQMPPAEFAEDWVPPLCVELARTYPNEAFDCPIAVAPETGKRLSPIKQAELDLQQASQLLTQDRIDDARELVGKVSGNSRLPNRLRLQAEQLESDIDAREDALVRDSILAGDDEELEDGEEAESDRRREIYLAHDLAAEQGGTFRYRAKIQAINQYAMVPDRLKEPADAIKAFIEGDWSEPSEPVTVPLLRRVFLTKADPADGRARFEIFIWTKGEWVKDGVLARVGDTIGKKEKVQHLGLAEKIEVDFDTGLRVLEVLPASERTYIPVKRNQTGGVDVQDPEPTSAVRCEDDKRQVVEFLEEQDKTSEEKRLIVKEMDAKKRAARGRP